MCMLSGLFLYISQFLGNLVEFIFAHDPVKHYNEKIYEKFPLAPMGVLAPGSAHARPSAQSPLDTSGKFSGQVSGRAESNLVVVAISDNSKHFSFFSGKTKSA